MGWLRLAARLGMSLDEVKMKTSAFQFVLWMEFLDWEINSFDVSNYYLAQIAAEIRRSYVGKKNAKVRIEDFIMKFKHRKEESLPTQTHTDKIKSSFFRLTGLPNKEK